jgi:hypothetical protein
MGIRILSKRRKDCASLSYRAGVWLDARLNDDRVAA